LSKTFFDKSKACFRRFQNSPFGLKQLKSLIFRCAKIWSSSQKYVPIDETLTASARVRLPMLSVLGLASLKSKNSGWRPQTV